MTKNKVINFAKQKEIRGDKKMGKPIIPVLEKTFKLLKWDPSGDTWITVRQAAAREQHRYEEETWAREISYEQAGGPITEKQKPSLVKVWLVRAKLTFIDSNISEAVLDKNGQPEIDEKTGEYKTVPLFKKGMGEREFVTAWSKLPVELVEEWDNKIVELNPHWGGRQFQCPECGYTGQMDIVDADILGED